MRWILALIWLAFITYAWIWAPGQPLGSDPVFKELVTLQSKEPWLLTVFSWLGIYPAIFACLLLRRSGKDPVDRPAHLFNDKPKRLSLTDAARILV